MRRAFLFLLVTSAAVWSARPVAQTPATAPRPATAAQAPAAAAAGGRLIEITASDKDGKYLFTPATINAKPGEQLRVRLKAVSTMKMPKMAMSHNFILLALGASPATFTNEGAVAGFPNNFIAAPRKKDVLAETALAGADETVEVSFKAPAAGTYTYLCSFPGHFAAGMKGSLIVK